MRSTETSFDILDAIRGENLAVYRASPQRLQEDLGQEAQIAQDYRGRLIYELLQNADDAMSGPSEGDASIRFVLLPDALWVANSGRPLNEADIRGLCGIGASSKGVAGHRRASIGHKGMGFKSVLEITEAPEVYSTAHSLRFGPTEALRAVQDLVDAGVLGPVASAPICRFPWPVTEEPDEWQTLQIAGFRTAFRFPLRNNDRAVHSRRLGEALRSLPLTSLIFLKNLRRVEIELRLPGVGEQLGWTVNRFQEGLAGSWNPVPGFHDSGVYRVSLDADDGAKEAFLLAYDGEIPIGNHGGGLDRFNWEGIGWTEVCVAARLHGTTTVALPDNWRKLHVFLPSGEPCPYHLLVSGAFNANLSRQEIRIEPDESNYNRFLLRQAARLLRQSLIPAMLRSASTALDVLALLDRGLPIGAPSPTPAAETLYEAVVASLADFPFVPSESGEALPINECAVPPLVADASVGADFRALLPPDIRCEGKRMPVKALCAAKPARVLADHGATVLSPSQAAATLAKADPDRSTLIEHPSGGLSIDPVLRVLERLWDGLPLADKAVLCRAARAECLFPVGLRPGGDVRRVATQDVVCFYPPRSLHGEIPLTGLCFLMQELCWGALTPSERNAELKREMAAWQALFDIREFKFPDVMRASVLPALELDGATSGRMSRQSLRHLDCLAAICQLSGRTPDRTRPLPYERLGPNRALLNLSRLDVPCRGESPNEVRWVPAYRAYLGTDWVGEDSMETVVNADDAPPGLRNPAIHFLVGPLQFRGLLDRYRHLKEAMSEGEDIGEDEVSLEEDDEAALDADDNGRWLEFFLWLGVNQALRAVHFHDAEDRGSGWLKTPGLVRPEGWAFQQIHEPTWSEYVTEVRGKLRDKDPERFDACVPYFYRLHDLEHLVPLLAPASRDASGRTGRRLYEHRARNWSILERFAELQVALVPREQVPSRRSPPPRARDEELENVGDDFWIFRLRKAAFCPTGQGPRRADRVWLPTLEVQRRFGRRVRAGTAYLVPTLEVSPALLKGKPRNFALVLGMREELTAASFTVADARILLDRLRDLYAERFARDDDLRSDLREVIRPAYRHLLELLSGRDRLPDVGEGRNAPLGDAPVLAQDALGHFSFKPASEVYFIDRPETRDRLQANEPIWSFVLESFRSARSPLSQLFGMRVLEDELRWSPQRGDAALVGPELDVWRSHLRDLAPYALARVGAERVEEAQSRQDARFLRRLIEAMEPVTHLELRCELDGRQVGSAAVQREAFVEDQDGESVLAFIRWGEQAWPPSDDDAEALATAFGEVLGPGYFESFLALAKAPSAAARERLLRRAGAPVDLEDRRLLFAGEEAGDRSSDAEVEPDDKKTAAAPPPVEQVASPPGATGDGDTPPRRRVPLFTAGQLRIQGEPVQIKGPLGDVRTSPDQRAPGKPSTGTRETNGSGGYGGQTNLDELDSVGMAVVLTYERSRLRRTGVPQAMIFDSSSKEEQPHAMVFDVTQPSHIELARSLCRQFDSVFRQLEAHGVSAEWPGFDVLSLNPTQASGFDRLIELKSSGVSSLVQEMSWNEWKTARGSVLRQHYYLYLVGNLRSDLNGTRPFLRAIRNPVEQLAPDVRVDRRLAPKVHLAVDQFREAEHLDLTVVEEGATA
jgi:hypothetical protein